MRSRRLRGPTEATGALTQWGSRRRHSRRKAFSRGQSGQSRPGLPEPSCAGRSVLEIVVVIEGCAGAGPLRRRGPLQKLRRMALARLARFSRRALGGVTAALPLQLDDIEEDVGLPAPPRRDPLPPRG